MFWSKSEFFKQNMNRLKEKREQIVNVLKYKGVPNSTFLSAYDYFVYNPSRFDGATIAKDLKDIEGLDLSAMVHDYQYIVQLPKYKGVKWLVKKIEFDWRYGRNMELLGKGITIPYSRTIALILSTFFYWLMVKCKNIKS